MKIRSSLSLSLLLTLSAAAGALGCSSNANPGWGARAHSDPITDVNQGGVKDQSIGNCWIYATSGWVESLAKTAGKDLNVSESYFTYWHWYEQIANGGLRGTEVATGGSWDTATRLIGRYGLMTGGDFIPDDGTTIYSARQSSALSAINASLKTGALKDAASRGDRALVRKELDAAWGLSKDVSAMLDGVFGADVSTTLDGADVDTSQTKVVQAKDVAVAYVDAASKQQVTATLADMFGGGDKSWGEVSYPSSASGRRQLQKRIQSALHDHQPVVLSWLVDFNALDADGRFFEPPKAPGSQGGHMVVMQDYEIDNVPGFGTLAAGTPATPEQEQAALDDGASIHFFRIKNSWGDYKSAKTFATKGYHDLYMAYLNGPVKQCETDANEKPILTNCWDATPFWSVVLPAGY